MKALLVLVSLLVAGCAAAGWTRPNTTEAEIRRDSYECERDQRMVGGSFQNVTVWLSAQCCGRYGRRVLKHGRQYGPGRVYRKMHGV